MLRPLHGFALLTLGVAGGCTTVPPIMGDPAVTVTARAETPPVGTAREDAADDPAIWRNPANPAASLVVGTDKKGGLYVYDLKGAQKSFLAAPGLNNVDLIEIAGGRVLVEGVGGWLAPLADGLEQADLARALDLPVVLVVGLRLGCLNHARLTARAVHADGCRLAGWIGNQVEAPGPHAAAYLDLLRDALPGPCLGVLPFAPGAAPADLAAKLSLA